jgi:AraC-like DNA-binding protein
VCGFLGCDSRPFNPLLESLPRILHVKSSTNGRSRWIDEFTRFAVLEAKEKRAGGNGILAKLGELMFVELVRHYVETLPQESQGWLAGLRDRHVGRALTLLHESPGRDWTLDQLAKDVGVSRSLLAERFTSFVGTPPMQYLQKWRLQMAASRLLDGISNIATIAAEIGYESDAAFSRAFKKAVGVPPAEWRSRKAIRAAL